MGIGKSKKIGKVGKVGFSLQVCNHLTLAIFSIASIHRYRYYSDYYQSVVVISSIARAFFFFVRHFCPCDRPTIKVLWLKQKLDFLSIIIIIIIIVTKHSCWRVDMEFITFFFLVRIFILIYCYDLCIYLIKMLKHFCINKGSQS